MNKDTGSPIDNMQPLNDAHRFLENARYDESAVALRKMAAMLANSPTSFDIDLLVDKTLMLLQTIEPTHERQSAKALKNVESTIAPSRTIEGAGELVDAISASNKEKAFALKGYLHYLRRELAEATDFFRRAPKRTTFVATMLATCLMLDDRPKEAFEEIKYAKTLEPDDSEVKRLYDAITKRLVHAGNSRLISSRWPEMMQNQDNLKGLFKRLILPEAGPPRALFEKNSKVVTIGSCFAMNISAALGRSGIDAVPFFFGEEVNNTASNLAVFEMLVSNDTQSSFEGADSEFIKSALEFGKHLAASDVLILTLGVSFGFFSKDGHPLLLKNTGGIDRSILSRATNRRLDVPENVRNCIKIFEIARKLNPKLRFVVTVSPVPLARAFGFRSAIHADAISKSTLRLVAHELTEIDSNIVYWPSFEMAKWLAPHIKQGQNGFFGADDESSRHVSLHVIEAITTLFIEHFGPQT